MVTRKPLPLEGKPEGSRTPRSCVTLWKTPIGKHIQGGITIPNSTLSTLWLVAALTLCSLQMLLQVLPPQAAPMERTSPRESSNRKHHQQCKCVCVWVNEMNSIRLTQASKQGTLARIKTNRIDKPWIWFKGWFSYSQGTITKSTTSKMWGAYNMDLGSLNYTRKLSQDVFRQYGRVERVRHKRNRRNLFIENKTDARAIDRTVHMISNTVAHEQ